MDKMLGGEKKQKTIEARYKFELGYDDASCNQWDGLRKWQA